MRWSNCIQSVCQELTEGRVTSSYTDYLIRLNDCGTVGYSSLTKITCDYYIDDKAVLPAMVNG